MSDTTGAVGPAAPSDRWCQYTCTDIDGKPRALPLYGYVGGGDPMADAERDGMDIVFDFDPPIWASVSDIESGDAPGR